MGLFIIGVIVGALLGYCICGLLTYNDDSDSQKRLISYLQEEIEKLKNR